MASTGSTEGYQVDNFNAQGSTATHVGGLLQLYANSCWRWLGSTYTNGSTLPNGSLSVIGATTNASYTLASARPGNISMIICREASSSALQTVDCQVTMDNSTRSQINFARPGGVVIYALSTTAYTTIPGLHALTASSDVIATT